MAVAMEYDPRVSAACDALRTPCKYGARTVRPNVVITWWSYDGSEYSAVASGPRGRTAVRATKYPHTAQESALAAYVHGVMQTYEEEQEWT